MHHFTPQSGPSYSSNDVLFSLYPAKDPVHWPCTLAKDLKLPDNSSEQVFSTSGRRVVSTHDIMFAMCIVRSTDARIPVSFPDPGGSFTVRVVRSDWN